MAYNYLRVAMHGHFDNKLSLRYSFNGSPDPTQGWEASLPDPEAIVRSFMSVRDCYVMWHNHNGRYFSLITTSPLDPSAGRVMITILLEQGKAIAGRRIYSALSQLKKAFFEDGLVNDRGVEGALQAAMLPEEALDLPSWKAGDPARDVKPMGYRTYLSTRELEGIFSFPAQPDYLHYRYVIVISATSSLRPGMAIERITAPLKKEYDVLVCDGVTASQLTVDEGQRFTLTLTKEGFAPRKETVTAGTPSPYVRYEGSAIVVKQPSESSIGFVKKVRMEVSSAKGGVVTGYTVSVNDRPVNTMDNFIELTEDDLKPGRKVVIQAASNNFRPLKVELLPEEINADTVIRLNMVPFEQGIVLRLDFGEGRVMEQVISLEKNTPEYSQLRSGLFHGFRAHRVSSAADGQEMYNVDVRAAGKPMAPVFENITKSAPRQQQPAPVAAPVAAPAPAVKEAGKPEEPKPGEPKRKEPAKEEPKAEEPAKKPGKDTGKDVPDYVGVASDKEEKGSNVRWGFIAGALAIVAVIICFIIFLPEILTREAGADNAGPEQGGAPAVEVVDSPVADAPGEPTGPAAPAETAATAAAADPALTADAAYLDGAPVWDSTKVSGADAKALFTALENGDIQAFVNNPYFVKGLAHNADANNVADLLWKAYGSDTQRSNELKMQKAAKAKDGVYSVDLHELYEQLARVRPKTPNAAARPGTAN